MNAMTKAEGKAEPVEFEAPDGAEARTGSGAETSASGTAETPAAPKKKRGGLRLALMIVVPAVMVIGGAWYWVTGGRYEETDNAYLQQPKVEVAANASGRVTEVNVSDNQHVTKGEVLFRIDAEPYRIALEQAEADLAAARISVSQLRSAYSQAVAQQRVASSEVDYLQSELERQQALSGKGISSRQALDTAQRNLTKARDSLAAAKETVAGALAALGGKTDFETDQHPSVLKAKAARDKAAYELAQTSVEAPADGVIAQAESFKTGAFVSAGTPLFALVETENSWVNANFKETQLTYLEPGQEAEVTFDTYPDHPVRATVDSIGAGTGAEFSLLPAQNATGNWVKVTQRIPVRLKLDANDVGIPLRTGMSANASVDTEMTRGFASFFGGGMAHASE